MLSFFKLAFHRQTIFTALKVSFVVGIILNLINQMDILYACQFEKLNVLKVILTFIVPFLVSVYSTTKTKIVYHIDHAESSHLFS